MYLGIWYRQIQPRTYVWLANRDAPVTSSFAKLTIDDDGNISLVDRAETVVWSSNRSTAGVDTVAQLLDSGNFVVRRENDDDPENYIWQSFDYPTDTLLPEMKLGLSHGINRFIKSWKTTNDPASGDYSLEMSITGFPEIIIWNKKRKISRSGPFNGRRFSGIPEMKGVSIMQMQFEFQMTYDDVYYSYTMLNASMHSRLIINSSGHISRYNWAETTKTWILYWFFPRDECDNFRHCGTFGICDANRFPVCRCLDGLRPRDERAWFDLQDVSGGCVRSSKLDCGSDGFLQLKNMKLPEASKAFVDKTMNLSMCRESCKRDCSCRAYANMNVTRGGSGCAIWAVDLTDTRQYVESESGSENIDEGGGQDLYVRVAASDLVQSPTTKNSKKGKNVVKIVAIVVGACVGLITLSVLIYLKRKNTQRLKKSIALRRGPQERTNGKTDMDELDLPLFDFITLAMATNNFSDANELGRGGFGCVYKVVEYGHQPSASRTPKFLSHNGRRTDAVVTF
ncbi:hypothetical protein L6452_35382 [Arctium lappa]|uniref:Uncharacterized protein n=1 Tax=Arctium lappa TaxID=4217 RepID=A0ACB8Y6X3_ARCLA|nr:hypothetical protein L6452_35382 [Arctium lappa]